MTRIVSIETLSEKCLTWIKENRASLHEFNFITDYTTKRTKRLINPVAIEKINHLVLAYDDQYDEFEISMIFNPLDEPDDNLGFWSAKVLSAGTGLIELISKAFNEKVVDIAKTNDNDSIMMILAQ